jgi:APA family basic amino acid/polyamine antiporter
MATALKRTIGPIQATAMVAGTIIGASIFVQPSVITAQVPSPGAVSAVWIVAGVLTLCGALVTAELASAFPATGGVYVFLREAYSPLLGFLWGWAMFWSMHTGIIAAIAMVFATYVGHFVALDAAAVRLVAIAAILALTAINYAGVEHGSRLQTAFTVGKVAAIAAIVIAGFALGPRTPAAGEPVGAALAAGWPPPRTFALALVAGLFAFGGWHMVTYAAGETVAPERTIPRALLAGTLVVTGCYVALNAVYFHVLPVERVIASQRIAADAADAVLGSGAAGAASGLVIFSTFGALSGIVLAGPRVYYSMARDGLLFRWLGETHPRFQTPHRATAMQGVWAAVLVATGTYRELFTRVVYTEWIFFGLMAAGLVLLRRRESYAPRYRVWGYPWIPLAFAVSSGLIVLNQVAAEPGESAVGLSLVALGIPVYWLWTRAHGRVRRTPDADHRLP